MTSYTLTTIDEPKATNGTYAQGINDNGQLVGYYVTSSGDHAFILNSGAYSDLFTIPLGYGSSDWLTVNTAQDINNSGKVVGNGSYVIYSAPWPSSNYAVQVVYTSPNDGYWADTSDAQWSDIEAMRDGTSSNLAATYASGLNNVGAEVGYVTDQGATHGYIDSNGTISLLNYSGATATYARGVNDLTQVVGYWVGQDSNFPNTTTAHGFYYNGGAWSFFDDPNGINGTFAEDINNSDVIVGYYVDGNGNSHGFVFNRPTGVYTTVDFPGATNTSIYGINKNGQIVGSYVDGAGNIHGFMSLLPTWNLIDSGSPVALAAGDFSGAGSAQLIASYSGLGTYSYSASGWAKIDNGSPGLMTTGNFTGSGEQLIGIFGGYGTYDWTSATGWTKIDNGTPSVITAGDFSGSGHDQLAGVFGGYGTYTWSSGIGWQKIDNGTPGLLASGDFTAVGHAELAGVFAGYGTYTWISATGWTKIDNGTPNDLVAGDFYGDGKSELAGYFAGYGTYIWSGTTGWTKITAAAASGFASVDLNGDGKNELLTYFPGSGVYEWQQNLGWSKYDNTSALPSSAQQALFASGNFKGGSAIDAAVTFPGQGGVWLDPPSEQPASPLLTAPITVADGVSVELTDTSAAAVAFAGSGTLQLDQSLSFFGTVAGFGAQDQIDLRDIGSSGAVANFVANQNDTGGTLTVTDGNHTAGIGLLGSYMASTFVASADAQGGTLVSVLPQTDTILLGPHAAT